MDELINREGTLDVPQPEYEWIIKDPYVLNLQDLPANEHFYESSLERTPIGHLQKFLLELSYGFSFVTRQKHFNVDGRRFYTQNVCHAGLFVYLEYIVKLGYGRMMYPLYPAPAKKAPPPRESKRFKKAQKRRKGKSVGRQSKICWNESSRRHHNREQIFLEQVEK